MNKEEQHQRELKREQFINELYSVHEEPKKIKLYTEEEMKNAFVAGTCLKDPHRTLQTEAEEYVGRQKGVKMPTHTEIRMVPSGHSPGLSFGEACVFIEGACWYEDFLSEQTKL